MIDKEAVKQFLARPRKSWSRYKRWSRADVLEELDARGIPRRFKTTPRKHQLVCYLLGAINPRFMFFLDPGLGKTKLLLDLFGLARSRYPDIQALVLVPKKVHMGTWAAQVREHSDFNLLAVDVENSQGKWDALERSRADITVIDYQGLTLAVTVKKKVRGKNELVRDDARVRKLAAKYEFVAPDEFHRCKNHNTTRFGILRQLRKHTLNFYGLTATPTGRDPQDLWAQFFLVDGGHALGESLGLFREAMFTKKSNYFGGHSYTFDKRNVEQLARMSQHCSITYTEDECLDLPKRFAIKREFNLTPEQYELYNEFRKGKIVEDVRVPYEGVFIRMREITSGYTRKVVNGVHVTTRFKENPKLDLFESDLLEMPAGRKALVFYDYNPTFDIIADLLREHKIKFLALNGATSAREALTIEDRFRDDASIPVLLCNSASGSEGLNAQVANYQFFYESPPSPITRLQAIKRAHRQGQTRRCLVFDYVARKTVDQKILDYLEEGEDLMAALKAGSGRAQRALFT